jgi:hypothetical protein
LWSDLFLKLNYLAASGSSAPSVMDENYLFFMGICLELSA